MSGLMTRVTPSKRTRARDGQHEKDDVDASMQPRLAACDGDKGCEQQNGDRPNSDLEAENDVRTGQHRWFLSR